MSLWLLRKGFLVFIIWHLRVLINRRQVHRAVVKEQVYRHDLQNQTDELQRYHRWLFGILSGKLNQNEIVELTERCEERFQDMPPLRPLLQVYQETFEVAVKKAAEDRDKRQESGGAG